MGRGTKGSQREIGRENQGAEQKHHSHQRRKRVRHELLFFFFSFNVFLHIHNNIIHFYTFDAISP